MNRDHVKQQVRTLAPFVLFGVLMAFLFGPLILLAYPLQRWPSRQIWDARDRWKTVRCFALFGCLLYLPLLVWRTQCFFAWQQVALLGPATFVSLRFRTLILSFLVPTATIVLERLHPRTSYTLLRIKYPGDVAPLPTVSNVIPSTPGASKKKAASQLKAASSGNSTHHPEATPAHQRDPRPLGVVLYEEKQRRQAKQVSAKSASSSQSPPKTINWDEGEGTYREK